MHVSDRAHLKTDPTTAGCQFFAQIKYYIKIGRCGHQAVCESDLLTLCMACHNIGFTVGFS